MEAKREQAAGLEVASHPRIPDHVDASDDLSGARRRQNRILVGAGLRDQRGLFPENPSLENFRYLFTAVSGEHPVPFQRNLFNSVIVSAGTTLVGVFLACTAAYAFSRFSFPGRNTGMLAFLVAQMFPGS
jgi:ABC-type maltose transport system permease subunit